jgi:putative lipoprotein
LRYILRAIVLFAALVTSISAASAETANLEVTVSYRERIALPPDARLQVELIDVSRADAPARRIALQLFAMTSAPMTVNLPYDRQVIDDAMTYAIVAEIWSGDERLFRSTERIDPFDENGGKVDILLSMVEAGQETQDAPRSIAGVQWAATEVFGEPWGNDDPATLMIDDEMNFSLFGGCNRFRGQLVLMGGEIGFPRNFAGTLMACPDEVEALERRYLEALSASAGYVRYGAGLVMTDARGNAVVHFVEQPE